MQLIHVAVWSRGFRDASDNPRRLGLLAKLIHLSQRENAHLLLIPAGFLTAGTEEEAPSLVREMNQMASNANLALIGGVDVIGPVSKKSHDINDLVQTLQLPFFGFAVGRVSGQAGSDLLWRQTSIDNNNAELVPEEALPGQARVVLIEGMRIGVLICGELFSWRARRSISGTGADLVVDIGHEGMGQGLIPAMKAVAAEGGCPVAHSQHLGNWYGRSLHFVDGQGEQHSVAINEEHLVEHESLWAGWIMRTV